MRRAIAAAPWWARDSSAPRSDSPPARSSGASSANTNETLALCGSARGAPYRAVRARQRGDAITDRGSSSFSIEWALVQDKVAPLTRICSYDRAGFAWSDRGPEENTVEETMDDLHHLLDAAHVAGPYVLVGHSIGGMYVRAYQRRYPRDVVGLVLIDATPEEDAEYLSNGKSVAGVFLTWDQLAAVYAPYIKNPPPPRQLPTKVDEPDDRLSPALQRDVLWAYRLWLSRIDMP